MSNTASFPKESTTKKVLSEDAQTLLKNLQETLNEEKWTRATLSNYSTSQFKELDKILKTARNEKAVDELKKNCDEHLANSRNSIIALYLSGMVALSRQIIDDSAMINLVSIFLDNHKWSIVKYLCERILDHGESKFALRTLADCYKNDNEEELVFGVWERLVKVDFDEADIVKSLAEHYKKQNKKDETIDFYKKALHRYINKGNFANIREIWGELLESNIDDIDFFLRIQKKIAKAISEDRAVSLLNELYARYKTLDIDVAINILKIVLEYDERDNNARKEIIECFRKKYSGHSQLEEYIRTSNLSQNYRDVHKAISDFEKQIAFDKGNYVYHRTWGVGRIAGIVGDEIVIDFAKKRGHSMASKMAVDALQTLSREHIWVMKATRKKEELREKIRSKDKDDESIIWTLKTIIKSFPGTCDMKRIKAELTPALLTTGEWASWSSKARNILRSNPDFGANPDNVDVFTVRDRPVSVTEKLYNEFNTQKNFFQRVSAIRSYVHNKEADPNSEYFAEMLSYFTVYLRSHGENDVYTAASYLLIEELSLNKKYNHLKSSLTFSFTDFFKNFSDVPALYKNLKDSKLREDLLENIKKRVNNWPDVYVKLFPVALIQLIINCLETEGYTEKLTVMCYDCFDNFRDNREAVIWLYKNSRETSWFKAAKLSTEKQLITLIHILDITYRDIENNNDTVENRKINKQVYTILFVDGSLVSFIDTVDEETIIRLFTFINGIKGLDPQDKLNLRYRILEKHPGFKFLGDTEKVVSRSLIVTLVKFEEKKRQLASIMDEEIPANSKEIEFALSLGDLRENAEFKAAKEKQEQLNTTAAKLKEDLERAQLFDPSTVNTSRASFGTKVILLNETNGQREEYTILGPWESDPNNNIISYFSPLGSAILNKKTGEKFEFAMNEERISYVVEQILPAAI